MDLNDSNYEPVMDVNDNMDALSTMPFEPEELASTKNYAQTASNLIPDENGALWRLPLPFSPSTPATPDKWFNRYQKSCRSISSNWKSSDAQKWIPEQLIGTTPYSFTLLNKLKTLSRVTQGQRVEALNALQETRDQRLSSSQHSFRSESFKGTPCVEDEYIQRSDGVMLKDMHQVIGHFRAVRNTQKVQNKHKRHQEEQQIAVDRTRFRRTAKLAAQIKIQEEMYRLNMLKAPVELVGVEWALDGTNEQDHTTSQWSVSRSTKKNGRDRRRLVSMREIRAKAQPRTKEELTSTFRVDDVDRNWDSESDEEVEDNRSRDLANPDAEPVTISRRVRNRDRKKRGVQGQAVAVSEDVDKLDMSMEVSDASESDSAPALTPAQRREATRQHVKEVLADVAARSIQLPSERNDLSMIGKLEKAGDQKQISSMLDSLDAIAMDIDKKD